MNMHLTTLPTTLAVNEIEIEPRVLDTDLAQALGMAQPLNIRVVIRSHLEALGQLGGIHASRENPGPQGGRPSTAYWRNEEQAFFVTMHSNTPKALAVNVEVVKVFTAYRRGKLVQAQQEPPMNMHLMTLPTSASATMSSLEIAELTGKRHDNVMRDIRTMLEAIGGLLSFEDTYRNPQNGQTYPIYRLPFDETMTLIAGYDAALRFKIVRRWRELEQAKPALPDFTNPAVAARAWADEVEAKQIAQAQVVALKPLAAVGELACSISCRV